MQYLLQRNQWIQNSIGQEHFRESCLTQVLDGTMSLESLFKLFGIFNDDTKLK